MRRLGFWRVMGVVGCAAVACGCAVAQTQASGLGAGRQALAAKQFGRAKVIFGAWVGGHPESTEGELGLADAELGLHEYEAAEMEYRKVTAQQPEMWSAHKNLVIVEAALGRWEEFDRERAVLRGARERGEAGISKRESDVIDSFDVRVGGASAGSGSGSGGGSVQHWIVREYYEPVGRSLTRYNFERFAEDGRVKAYVSLESAAAAERALARSDVRIGDDVAGGSVEPSITDFALNWYTGKAHGTIARYPKGEPRYESVRAAVRRWLRIQPIG